MSQALHHRPQYSQIARDRIFLDDTIEKQKLPRGFTIAVGFFKDLPCFCTEWIPSPFLTRVTPAEQAEWNIKHGFRLKRRHPQCKIHPLEWDNPHAKT